MPCPDGTGVGYRAINDTIFLICDTAFYNDDSLALGLGLGLGLGIPFFAIIICMITRRYNFDCSFPFICWRKHNREKTVFPRESIESLLSESALGDFRFGNLSEELKNELMIIRLRQGRNLTEFVKFAEQLNYPDLANWIDKLNPGQFPPEIHKKARGHIQVTVSNEIVTMAQTARAELNNAKLAAAPNHELP